MVDIKKLIALVNTGNYSELESMLRGESGHNIQHELDSMANKFYNAVDYDISRMRFGVEYCSSTMVIDGEVYDVGDILKLYSLVLTIMEIREKVRHNVVMRELEAELEKKMNEEPTTGRLDQDVQDKPGALDGVERHAEFESCSHSATNGTS